MTSKQSTYQSMLKLLRSNLASVNDELISYKLAVDFLSKITHLGWVGVYFYNPVTEEFYLGYNVGSSPKSTVVKYNQLAFPRNQYDASYTVNNEVHQDHPSSLSPGAGSEAQILIKSNGKILAMICVGSSERGTFDDDDRDSLRELGRLVAEQVTLR